MTFSHKYTPSNAGVRAACKSDPILQNQCKLRNSDEPHLIRSAAGNRCRSLDRRQLPLVNLASRKLTGVKMTSINGTSDNAILIGMSVAKAITGGFGNDTPIRGAENEFLGGGVHDDTHIFSRRNGQDTIFDTGYSPDMNSLLLGSQGEQILANQVTFVGTDAGPDVGCGGRGAVPLGQ